MSPEAKDKFWSLLTQRLNNKRKGSGPCQNNIQMNRSSGQESAGQRTETSSTDPPTAKSRSQYITNTLDCLDLPECPPSNLQIKRRRMDNSSDSEKVVNQSLQMNKVEKLSSVQECNSLNVNLPLPVAVKHVPPRAHTTQATEVNAQLTKQLTFVNNQLLNIMNQSQSGTNRVHDKHNIISVNFKAGYFEGVKYKQNVESTSFHSLSFGERNFQPNKKENEKDNEQEIRSPSTSNDPVLIKPIKPLENKLSSRSGSSQETDDKNCKTSVPVSEKPIAALTKPKIKARPTSIKKSLALLETRFKFLSEEQLQKILINILKMIYEVENEE